MVAIMLLVLAARALQYLWEGGKANLFVLAGTLFLLLYMLNNPAKTKEVENILVVREIKSLSMLLLLLQAALLLGLSLAKGQLRKILFFVLLGISFLELFYFGVKTLANRPVITKTELAQKVGYNDYSVDAADKLRELDQASLFYRVSKNYNSGPSVHSSMNDGKVQNYFGSASYHSFNQKEYILFLKAMGIVDASNENATRWAVGVEPRPLLQTLTSHKYRFLRNAEAQAAGYGYSFAFELGDVKVYKNENFIPLGFVYRSAIDTARLSSLDPIQRDIALLRAVAFDDASKSSLPKLDSIPAIDQYSLDMLAADAAALRRDTVQWSSFSNKNLEGKLSLQEPGYLFFSIPYSKGWHIEINGEERSLEKVNIGFLGLPLDAGNYEIKLSYRLPYAHKLFWPSVLCFLGLIALFYYDYRRIREQQLLV